MHVNAEIIFYGGTHPDATVWIDGKRGSLTDLRQGDQVLITYEQRGDHWVANDVTLLKRR